MYSIAVRKPRKCIVWHNCDTGSPLTSLACRLFFHPVMSAFFLFILSGPNLVERHSPRFLEILWYVCFTFLNQRSTVRLVPEAAQPPWQLRPNSKFDVWSWGGKFWGLKEIAPKSHWVLELSHAHGTRCAIAVRLYSLKIQRINRILRFEMIWCQGAQSASPFWPSGGCYTQHSSTAAVGLGAQCIPTFKTKCEDTSEV